MKAAKNSILLADTAPKQTEPAQAACPLMLSPRQLEIVQLVSLGFSDKEIANELGLTEATVGWYLNQMFRRWRVHSRAGLAGRWLKGAQTETTAHSPTWHAGTLTNVRVVARAKCP